MRAVIQRVSGAHITINRITEKKISPGLVVFLGVIQEDTQEDIDWLTGKISRLRIFNDPSGVMNLSIEDVEGEIMIISQFTLHASTRKGNRPSYVRAAPPETAIPLYNNFVNRMEERFGHRVVTGEFGAYMQVKLTNDGPVTIIIDTKNRE